MCCAPKAGKAVGVFHVLRVVLMVRVVRMVRVVLMMLVVRMMRVERMMRVVRVVRRCRLLGLGLEGLTWLLVSVGVEGSSGSGVCLPRRILPHRAAQNG